MNNKHDVELGFSVAAGGDVDATMNRSPVGGILSPEMECGRDHMNLVEFPLAGLASRSPEGRDTLVFEDTVWDKQQRTHVTKRLTVAASAEYGLPNALDDEVILGLIQLAKTDDFSDRKVSFIPAELFRLLGWREEGRSYSRLETSLKRWLGVTLYYDHAWWDKERQVWCDEHFHLLENVTIRRRPGKALGQTPNRRQPWSVVWNEVMHRSCRAGYLKRLDMSVYRRLNLAAAKRMYRFLDKRFYFKNRLTFDLRTFACEHIGFRRGDDNSQLKRRLDRAISELQEIGFLEPMPKDARYRKVCHGRWEVLFVRKQPSKAKTPVKKPSSCEELLTKRGVREPVAAQLVREYTNETIRSAVRRFDESQNPGIDNPPGLLVTMVREEVAPVAETKPTPRKPAIVERQPTTEEKRRDAEQVAIHAYLEELSSEERESLESEAMKNATSFQLSGYRRAVESENARLLEQYRQVIVHAYVRERVCFLAGTSDGEA